MARFDNRVSAERRAFLAAPGNLAQLHLTIHALNPTPSHSRGRARSRDYATAGSPKGEKSCLEADAALHRNVAA